MVGSVNGRSYSTVGSVNGRICKVGSVNGRSYSTVGSVMVGLTLL